MNFYHERLMDSNNCSVSAKGGFTIAMEDIQPWFFETLVPGDFFEKKVGLARCSTDDNFCKKTGREVAEKAAKLRKLTVRNVFMDENSRSMFLQDDLGLVYELVKYKKAKAVFLVRIHGKA
jgi:hypothetical protein